ncbi:MAG: NRAMP family divalent metal transporter [Ignavibacteriales bacterium]
MIEEVKNEEVKIEEVKKKRFFNKLRKKFKGFGPGFVTGAADDDPSGVATYSIAGAQYGYGMNWLTMFLLPAMIVIQEMCGRIGLVSGKGLAGVIKKYYSKKVLYFAVSLLAIANVINIGADLGIVAACIKMLFGFNVYYWLAIVSAFIIVMEVFIPYKTYSKYLKWLGLSLCVYILTALIVKQDWSSVAVSTFIPHINFDLAFIMTMIGFLGTTISPYLFFWQPAEEIEEQIMEEKVKDFGYKPHIGKRDIDKMRFDTKVGMLFSNVITFFILLTTAATLHASGITNIETAEQAALALKPLAGNFAYILFAIGIIGIGWQSIPVLAGSLGYAVAETFGTKEGLSKPFNKAKVFYGTIALATAIGVVINAVHINIMQALYYAAIINGIASVPLIFLIIKLSDDERIVGKYKTKKINKVIAWITFSFIALSVLFMLYSLFFK